MGFFDKMSGKKKTILLAVIGIIGILLVIIGTVGEKKEREYGLGKFVVKKSFHFGIYRGTRE